MNAIPLSIPTSAAGTVPAGWRAELELEFAARAGRTILARRSHVGPLVVQRPFYPEGDVCHLYLLHPPGGIVGGDRLVCRTVIGSGAHALLTTPAATKFYRSAGPVAEQMQDIRLEQGTCEWLPQESIYFAAAKARIRTRVRLDPGSRFIGWEIGCFGRPASGEEFGGGEVYQSFELWCDERPLLVDRLRVGGGEAMLRARWGLGGYPVVGTLLAFPAMPADLESARIEIGIEPGEERRAGATLVDGVLVLRCFGRKTDAVRELLLRAWAALRPRLVGRPASAPRIWAT